MTGSDRVALAAAVVAAINTHDPERFVALLDPAIEIQTSNAYSGREEAAAWVGKRYDHLDRRYLIEETRVDGDQALILGQVEHVWREGGGVGDSAPIALTLGFVADRLRSLRVEDDREAAAAAFEA